MKRRFAFGGVLALSFALACGAPALADGEGLSGFDSIIGPSASLYTDGFGNTSGTFDGERVYLRRDRFGDTHGPIGGAFVALHRDEFGNIRGTIGGEYAELQKDRFGNTYETDRAWGRGK